MSYIIRKKKAFPGWQCQFESYPGGKRTAVTLKPSEYGRVGLTQIMNCEEAKASVEMFNNEETKLRIENKRQKILEVMREKDSVEVTHFPVAFEKAFIEQRVGGFRVGDKRAEKHFLTVWRAIRKLTTNLDISPYEWNRRSGEVYNYFAKHTLGIDYIKKILYTMNLWGEFLSDKQDRPYKRIKLPRGTHRENITDAYYEKLRTPKDSEPISPAELQAVKDKLKLGQWKWLYVSLWFGLRPEETTNLYKKTPDKGRLAHTVSEQDGKKVIWFYQWKKRGMKMERRWKGVPLLFPEQETALGFIEENKLERPIPKTLKRAFNKRVHLYGSRKGFQSLMFSLGRDFFEIADWMGHESIERTWQDYKNRQRAMIRYKSTG